MSKKNNNGNTKTYITFAAIMLTSGILGAVSLVGFTYIKFMFEDYDFQATTDLLGIVCPIVFAVVEVLLFAISAAIFAKANSLAKSWDGEDEDTIDKIERKLNFPILFTNTGMIFAMLMFGICAYFDKKSTYDYAWPFILTFVIFILSYVYILAIQAKTVNLEKKLNPEKRGNIFDMHFQKQWENSMDEAEKRLQCIAGNKAFKAGNFTCTILWIVSLVGSLVFGMDIGALLMVCIIWFVLSMTYIFEVMKLEKKKK